MQSKSRLLPKLAAEVGEGAAQRVFGGVLLEISKGNSKL
jgi:hypothetical protein